MHLLQEILNSTNYQLPTFTPHSQPYSHLLTLPQMAVVMTLRFSPAITKYVAGKFNVNVSMFCKYSCDASPPLSRRSCLLGRFGITCDSKHIERNKIIKVSVNQQQSCQITKQHSNKKSPITATILPVI